MRIEVYYVIRHIKTGELMPEVKTHGGYSHWNPDNPDMPKEIFEGHPRLFANRRKAKMSIVQWISCQNGRRHYTRSSFDGEIEDEDIKVKLDGRKKEDLEVVEVDLRIHD